MTPGAVLAALSVHGAALIVEEDRLRVRGRGEPLPDDVREGVREHRALLLALHTGPAATPSTTGWVLNAGRPGGAVVYLRPAVAVYGAARGFPRGKGEEPGAYVARLQVAILLRDGASRTDAPPDTPLKKE